MAKAFNIKEWQDKQKQLNESPMFIPGAGMPDPQYDGPDLEGKMAKGDVIEIVEDATDIAGMIGPDSNLPEWIESKITLAADYLNTVKDYLSNYEASREKLMEQGFDDRLSQAMGMSGDEFEDQVASRDIGSPFPGTGSKSSEGKALADRTIEHLRREHYRKMSDKDLDDFSAEMVEHFLDNTAAQARAKVVLARKGI